MGSLIFIGLSLLDILCAGEIGVPMIAKELRHFHSYRLLMYIEIFNNI